jgi:deoxyribodipyrimidine photo-lyase
MDFVDCDDHKLFPTKKEQVFKDFGKFCREHLSNYSNTRNFDLGHPHANVSKLSPYLRRRLVSENEVLQIALKENTISSLEKFIQEIFWRTYWRGWLEMRPGVYEDYVNGYDGSDLPEKTGIKCFDHWTEELIETGYLHNHARMWYASIWIFTLRKSWVSGANFFKDHLIDWCPASNTLGWRWVAGLQTRGKIYVAKADNIKLFTKDKFFPREELNENPFFNDDLWKTYERSVDTPYVKPNVEACEDTGVIINKNDLTLNDYLRKEQITLKGCIFHDREYQPSKSNLVNKFESDIIENLCSDLTRFEFCQTKKSLLNWAKSQKLRYLIFPYETVGNKYFMASSFINELRSQNIEAIFYMRDWDKYAFPFANKGFFPFKKNISKLLLKNGVV